MWGLVGLWFDLIGVLALGYDVIRIQRVVLASARENLRAYQKLDADYGGTSEWLSEIKKSLKWVPGYAFQDHHAQDDLSYNAERIGDLARDSADAASGIGEYVIAIGAVLTRRAKEDAKLSNTSLRLSAFGLAFIFVGFLLQAHGSALQICGPKSTGICAWLVWL